MNPESERRSPAPASGVPDSLPATQPNRPVPPVEASEALPGATINLNSSAGEQIRTTFLLKPVPLTAEQQGQLNAVGFCGSDRVGIPLIPRFSNFVSDLWHKGPAYAFFNFLMTGQQPVNPNVIRKLVALVPTPLIQLAVRFPNPAKREALIQDLSRISLTTGVVGHYDLSNALNPNDTLRVWEIMLGQQGFYSAADFDKNAPQMTLPEASQAKVSRMLELIRQAGVPINANTTFADLGCGWGAMVKGAIAGGVAPQNITAITTSPHQLDMLRSSALFHGVNVVNHDIIEGGKPPGMHDVILTIGGVEHTPPERMAEVFGTWASALNPNGAIVLEFFCDNRRSPLVRFDRPGISQTSLLAQLVFTGATVRDVAHYKMAWEEAGLEAVPETAQKLDPYCYARTMRAWADNLVQKRDEILAMNGGLGVWNHMMTYLVLGEWVFHNEMFETHRVILRRKEGATPIPAVPV